MLKEIVATSPDPTSLEERKRIKGAMFDTFGVRMFDIDHARDDVV